MPSAMVKRPNCGGPALQCAQHGWIAGGLDPDDAQLRALGLEHRGDAGDQPAAAHRHQQQFQLRRLVQQFQAHRALAGDDQLVVVGVDEGQAALGGDLPGPLAGLADAVAVQDHLRPEGAGARHLHVRRVAGHHDNRRDAQLPGVVSHRLGVVAGGHGDHPASARLRAQGFQLDQGPAVLERAGKLQVLQLQADLGPGLLRQQAGPHTGGAHHPPAQQLGGVSDVLQRRHRGLESCAGLSSGSGIAPPGVPAGCRVRLVGPTSESLRRCARG